LFNLSFEGSASRAAGGSKGGTKKGGGVLWELKNEIKNLATVRGRGEIVIRESRSAGGAKSTKPRKGKKLEGM